MSKYQALQFFTKHGTAIAALLGLAIPVATLLAMSRAQFDGLSLLFSVLAGCVVGFFIHVFSDLARVIVDMLLPAADYDSPPQE